MDNSWEERGRSIEEGYFRQKDNEMIAKMREKLGADQPQAAGYDCPKCNGKLIAGNFENIQIDVCNGCGGVWLDAGELQQITRKENQGWFGRLLT